MIEVVQVYAGILSCRVVVDTDLLGITQSGTTTPGSVLELRILSHKTATKKARSQYARFVLKAILAWAERDEKALDSIGVNIQGTTFQTKVLQAMRNIRFGKTVSYLELANSSGYQRAHRAVASVCAANRIPIIIPCHRIIKSDGTVGKYFYGSAMKETLLAFESRQQLL